VSDVTKTALYIDGVAKFEDDTKETVYTIEEKLFGFHKIKIVSIDLAGNVAIKELSMFIIS
jgi:hypothetical protein